MPFKLPLVWRAVETDGEVELERVELERVDEQRVDEQRLNFNFCFQNS